MEKISQYKENARRCREMARSAAAASRGALEQMARTWDDLAAERERQKLRFENRVK